MAAIGACFFINFIIQIVKQPDKINQLNRTVIMLVYVLVGITFAFMSYSLFKEMDRSRQGITISSVKKRVSIPTVSFD